MKDFKIIAEESKQIFEEKIKENLKEGYEMKNTNMSITINNMKMNKLRVGFYAYMEKEI